jgi:hypothetical protein
MTFVPFTRYANGQPTGVLMPVADDLAQMAHGIIAQGFRFEVEAMPSGEVLAIVGYDGAEYAVVRCPAGDLLDATLDSLIRNNHPILTERP